MSCISFLVAYLKASLARLTAIHEKPTFMNFMLSSNSMNVRNLRLVLYSSFHAYASLHKKSIMKLFRLVEYMLVNLGCTLLNMRSALSIMVRISSGSPSAFCSKRALRLYERALRGTRMAASAFSTSTFLASKVLPLALTKPWKGQQRNVHATVCHVAHHAFSGVINAQPAQNQARRHKLF